MRHLRFFTRKCVLPIAIVSSIAEGLTAVPALADVSYWIYQLIHNNNQYNNAEDFVRDNGSLFAIITVVALCGILTDYMLEGRNFIKQSRQQLKDPSDESYSTLADMV